MTYSSGASTTVFSPTETLGEYRFSRYEGRARVEVSGGKDYGLSNRRERSRLEKSSRRVVQPIFGDSAVLAPLPDGRVEMTSAGAVSTLRFFVGSWEEYSRGGDVALQFEDESWQRWARASQDGALRVLDGFRRKVIDDIGRDGSVSDGAITDFVVDAKPLVRVSRKELLVFFEPVTIEGSFEITTQSKDPDYSWWSYELQPDVAVALGRTCEFLAIAAVASLECCCHIACHR